MKQYTVRLEDELAAFIDREAAKPFSSANQVISLLLRQAIKERLRKRGSKEGNSEHNSADECTGDPRG